MIKIPMIIRVMMMTLTSSPECSHITNWGTTRLWLTWIIVITHHKHLPWHGSPAYSHQSKSHHGGVLTVMIMVGICHRRIPTIEYNDDDDNDNEKNINQCISICFVQLIPRMITYYESLKSYCASFNSSPWRSNTTKLILIKFVKMKCHVKDIIQSNY